MVDESIQALADELSQITGQLVKADEHIETAVTHRSFANEAPSAGIEDNERYEFLGDAVLQLTVSDLLMAEYPQEPEGVLSKYRSALVKERTLARAARSIRLGQYLRLGKGEELTQGRKKDSLLANAFEALVAALYYQCGIGLTEVFVRHCLGEMVKNVPIRVASHDFKTSLQELTQRLHRTTPEYRLVLEDGPDHAKTFESEVYVGETLLGKGSAHSKKDSEQKAAEEALARLSESEPTEDAV